MAHKILVADDSLTVQKVVSITLASYDYELVECKDESQLNEQLMIGGVSLLLLDLNLSEGKTGYEIAKDVRVKHPNLPIILLLGTFDTVDEAAFSSAGLNERIVKPFESNIFIQKVQSTLEAGPDASVEDSTLFSGETESNFLNNNLEDITPEAEEVIDNGDNWVVDSPAPVDKSDDSWDSFSQVDSKNNENALESSLEGWGMNVPSPIDSLSSGMEMDLPAVISEKVNEKIVTDAIAELDIVHDEEESLPSDTDLDYPDVAELSLDKGEQTTSKEIDQGPTSAFLSTEEFNLDVEQEGEEDLEATDPQYTLPSGELLSSIGDESDPDDFWAVDSSDGDTDMSANMAEELEAEDDDSDEYHAEPDIEGVSEITQESISLEPLGDPRGNEPFEIKAKEQPAVATAEIDKDALVAKIIEELKPTLHELIEKSCKETIESVAWQIIPDLAENLIRNEIKDIKEKSESV